MGETRNTPRQAVNYFTFVLFVDIAALYFLLSLMHVFEMQRGLAGFPLRILHYIITFLVNYITFKSEIKLFHRLEVGSYFFAGRDLFPWGSLQFPTINFIFQYKREPFGKVSVHLTSGNEFDNYALYATRRHYIVILSNDGCTNAI